MTVAPSAAATWTRVSSVQVSVRAKYLYRETAYAASTLRKDRLALQPGFVAPVTKPSGKSGVKASAYCAPSCHASGC